MLISITFILLAIVAYAISQLQQHKKLKWSNPDKPIGFWGEDSYLRKYKYPGDIALLDYGTSWYYRFFKVKYKERFPLSATFLVFLTDGYHLCQALFFLFLSLSFLPYGWKATVVLYVILHVVHFVVRKVFER